MSDQTLAPHWQTWVAEQVRAGHYGTETEVIEEALRRMEQREAKLAALRDAIDEGEQSGPAEPIEDVETLLQQFRVEAALR